MVCYIHVKQEHLAIIHAITKCIHYYTCTRN